MTENQKLREAFELGWKMAANWSLSDHLLADMESPAYLTERDGLLQALATTEPVMANGLTEAETDANASVMGLSRSRDSLNKLVDIMRLVDAYAYDYTKEGKFAKSRQQVEWAIVHELNKIAPTGKQSLQVEPAVNQQLTTEPFDEREAFEKWLGIKPCGAAHDFGWSAWQARAALREKESNK